MDILYVFVVFGDLYNEVWIFFVFLINKENVIVGLC